MIIAANAAPTLNISSSPSDYRFRPVIAERTLLPDSTPAASRPASTGDASGSVREAAAEAPPPVEKDSSAMFAAAVISGALSPTPQTIEELMVRIGTSTIPEEFEARIKDLMA